MNQAVAAIPVSLLTGFLGSGKTTLLNALLKHPGMADSAVLVNEFGEIGIDHLLVEKIDDDMVQLSTGCLCCSIQGDLSRSLREMFLKRVKGEAPPFVRVLVESTGLADPAPVLHTLMSDPVVCERYALDGVIATVDAVNGGLQLGEYPESRKQAAVADRIVMTKSDLADDGAMETLERDIRALNPSAPILRAVNGAIDPDSLFGCGLYDPRTKSFAVQDWLREEAFRDDGGDHHHHDVNRHDDRIRAFCMSRDAPVDWAAFIAWIQTLITHRGDHLLRIKGIVNIAGETQPIAIHGVQHLFHNPVRLPEWPDDDRRSRIVFITRDLDRDVIEKSLDALQKAAEDNPS